VVLVAAAHRRCAVGLAEEAAHRATQYAPDGAFAATVRPRSRCGVVEGGTMERAHALLGRAGEAEAERGIAVISTISRLPVGHLAGGPAGEHDVGGGAAATAYQPAVELTLK